MSDNTPWQVHTGTYSRRYLYWVGRTRDNKTEFVPNQSGDVRKFASLKTAQKVADKLQVTADFNDAREHARLAVHHMIRATDHLQPDHPIMKTLHQMADIYLELTGEQL